MAKKQHVVWNPIEAADVAHRVAELMNNQGREMSNTSTKEMLQFFRAAQVDTFAENRQRPLRVYSEIVRFIPLVEEALAAMQDPDSDTSEQDEPLNIKDLLGQTTLDELLDLVVDKMADRLSERLLSGDMTRRIAMQLFSGQSSPEPSPAPKSASTERRIVVGIVGLIARQHRVIEQKFPGVAFKFYEKVLPRQLPSVDYMIGMGNFLGTKSRGSDQRASHHYGASYIRLGGGMTNLEAKINQLTNRFFK